jgi:hypothetical protein
LRNLTAHIEQMSNERTPAPKPSNPAITIPKKPPTPSIKRRVKVKPRA